MDALDDLFQRLGLDDAEVIALVNESDTARAASGLAVALVTAALDDDRSLFTDICTEALNDTRSNVERCYFIAALTHVAVMACIHGSEGGDTSQFLQRIATTIRATDFNIVQ